MVLNLSIENAVPTTFQGDQGPVTVIQVVMKDKTKPAIFRTRTNFVLNMTPAGFRAMYDTLEVEDEKVTVLVQDMSGSGTMVKLRGELIKGWANQEQIEALARVRLVMPDAPATEKQPLVPQESVEAAAKAAQERISKEAAQKKAA